MRLREKGSDGEPVTMSWDEAQAALAAGTHEVAEGGGEETGITRLAASEGRVGGQSAGQSGEGGGQAPDDGFDAKTRPELEAIAGERGIDVSGARTKADVIEALRKAA